MWERGWGGVRRKESVPEKLNIPSPKKKKKREEGKTHRAKPQKEMLLRQEGGGRMRGSNL